MHTNEPQDTETIKSWGTFVNRNKSKKTSSQLEKANNIAKALKTRNLNSGFVDWQFVPCGICHSEDTFDDCDAIKWEIKTE